MIPYFPYCEVTAPIFFFFLSFFLSLFRSFLSRLLLLFLCFSFLFLLRSLSRSSSEELLPELETDRDLLLFRFLLSGDTDRDLERDLE